MIYHGTLSGRWRLGDSRKQRALASFHAVNLDYAALEMRLAAHALAVGIVPRVFDHVPLVPLGDKHVRKGLTLAFGYGMSFARAWGMYVCPEYEARARRRRRRRK